jgi:2-polyprenyl-3-methyl-5-hydroxy-6-metoxy-1,4-benzoquinol methylase
MTGTPIEPAYVDWPRLYPNHDWEEEYRNGQHEHMSGLGELPHYALVAGYVRRFVSRGKLLDAGCGEAHLALYLDLDNIDYLGFDISSTAVAYANRKLTRGRALCCSFDEFVTPKGATFDAIVFDDSLRCIAAPFETIDRFRAFLAPDGIIVVTAFLNGDGSGKWFTKFLKSACHEGRFTVLDMAEARSLSRGHEWCVFALR